MSSSERPRLRLVDSFPGGQQDGQPTIVLRDPQGFANAVVIPYVAAVLASFMDGRRTLGEIQADFEQQFRQRVDLADLKSLVEQLDQRCFLESDRFRARWKQEVEAYLNMQTRPAAHAGGAYEAEGDLLRKQLADLFTNPAGPGAPLAPALVEANGARLCGVLSPHIDLRRGGPAFAWAYKRIIEESDADLFVIFGTAHMPLRNLFATTRKNFATPLGLVETDRTFISTLQSKLAADSRATQLNLLADELAHRNEHSIEFQVVFLQYLLSGRRSFKIVPILTGSFHEFVASGRQPGDSPEVAAFVAAMQATAAEHAGKICYISGGDLAHIGQRFGDRGVLDPARLEQQSTDDRALLAAACAPDAAAFFNHVAAQKDRNRICGLAPTYTMLQVMQPGRGEFLIYDQAVERDGSSCVSFGSLAFYET